jgi:hypothetical protein
MTAPLLASALSPFSTGTSDATDSTGSRGREPGEPGPTAGLREEALAAGRLDGERRHEAHHGEPAVDALQSRPAERQRIP